MEVHGGGVAVPCAPPGDVCHAPWRTDSRWARLSPHDTRWPDWLRLLPIFPESCRYSTSRQNKGIKRASTVTRPRRRLVPVWRLKFHTLPRAPSFSWMFFFFLRLVSGKIKVINSSVLLFFWVKLKESEISWKHSDKELSIKRNRKKKLFSAEEGIG